MTITPHVSCMGYDKTLTLTSVTIKGFNKEFQTPRKYQMKMEAKTPSGLFLTRSCDEFQSINSKQLQFFDASHERDSILKNLSPSGSLEVNVTLTLKIQGENKTCSVFYNPVKFYKQIASNNLKMLENSQFSDFTFIVEGQKFEVHRNILAGASPVFATLFNVQMQESRSGQCIVKEIKPEIFKSLLLFIYGRKLPENLAQSAMELYEAAHYYEIESLQKICVAKLPALLTVDNALEFVTWARKYDEEDLKLSAWRLIKR